MTSLSHKFSIALMMEWTEGFLFSTTYRPRAHNYHIESSRSLSYPFFFARTPQLDTPPGADTDKLAG
jgi:hypothetical protein